MSTFQIDFGAQDRVVGIDLGTTNSLVAYMDLTGPEDHPGRGWRQAGAQRRLAESGRRGRGGQRRRASCC